MMIAFTGGGTAGHVYPAFPVIEKVRGAGFDVFWIGSANGMEKELVRKAGIPYFVVPSGKLRRYFSLRNFFDIFLIMAGFFASLRMLRRKKPVLLFSKGGFVSVPPVAAARFLRIPAFTHESDVDPGLATKLNILFRARPLVAYKETLSYLKEKARRRATVVGNPVRADLFNGSPEKGRIAAGLSEDDKRPLILVLGGSQGALEVNRLVHGCLDKLLSFAAVVHQTGRGNPSIPEKEGYLSRPFFGEELPHLLAAASLALGRSGAGTVWELAGSGVPSILIPLREGTRGDQIRNASLAEATGMSFVLPKNSSSEYLAQVVEDILFSEERLSAMKGATSAFQARESADKVFRSIMEAQE